MVPEAASDEVVVDLAEGIPQVHQDNEIPSVVFFRISHHEVKQLSVFKDSILAMSKTFLNVIVVILINIQEGL